MKLDLNGDLGEGEPPARTRALMRCITSANVACGGHAGDAATMRACALAAKQFGVRLGAHPGPWSREDRGRSAVQIAPAELELLLLQQVSALEKIASGCRMELHHVKLHGALYHATESDEKLARAYVRAVKRWWPRLKIYALAGGTVFRAARRLGVPLWQEAFADRGYRDDGSLVSRDQPGALVTDVTEVSNRVAKMADLQQVKTVTGHLLRLRPQTICVHSDTPNSPSIARALASLKGTFERRAARPAVPTCD